MSPKRKQRRPARGRQQQRPRTSAATSRPRATTAARPWTTPGASPLRQKVERRSALPLVFLNSLPRLVTAALPLGLVAAGLALPVVAGAPLLAAAAVLLGWLLYLSWPRLPSGGRGVRAAVIAIIVVAIGLRVAG